MDLTDPTAVALDIAEVLQRGGVDYALYGGLLLAAYGQARETKDADLAVVRALGPDLDTGLLQRELDGLAKSVGSHPVRDRWERVRVRS